MPNRNRVPVAIFISIAMACVVFAVIAGVVVFAYTWPATYEVACDLGDQRYCDAINTISTVRFIAFISLVAFALLAGVFGILAVLFAAFGRRSEDIPVSFHPMTSPPSTPPHQQPMPPNAMPPAPPGLQHASGERDHIRFGDVDAARHTPGPNPSGAQDQPSGLLGMVAQAPLPLLLFALSGGVILILGAGLVLLFAARGPVGVAQLPLPSPPTQTAVPTATPVPTPIRAPTATTTTGSSVPSGSWCTTDGAIGGTDPQCEIYPVLYQPQSGQTILAQGCNAACQSSGWISASVRDSWAVAAACNASTAATRQMILYVTLDTGSRPSYFSWGYVPCQIGSNATAVYYEFQLRGSGSAGADPAADGLGNPPQAAWRDYIVQR